MPFVAEHSPASVIRVPELSFLDDKQHYHHLTCMSPVEPHRPNCSDEDFLAADSPYRGSSSCVGWSGSPVGLYS